MDTAENVMWTRPDSALAALESIDTLSLKTKAQRARYSLLYTMALDRNHITIPDLRVIKPAASYYERYGSNDDRMKMYFYLGTAQYDTGDPESAIASYIRAKEYSSRSDNMMFRGIISSSLSASSLENQRLARITNKFTNNSRFVRIVLYCTLLDSKTKTYQKFYIIQYCLLRILTIKKSRNMDTAVTPVHIKAFCHHLRTLTSFSMTVSTTWAFCSSRYRSL